MNVGGLNDSFAVPTLMVLREVKDPNTRFAKYKEMWPAPDGLVNSCNMHEKYIKMWKSEYWERNQRDWQYHLESLHKGALNPDIEYTIEEVVGNTPVSIEDLKYACAISSTRYVSTVRRRRLLMAPVFDLANHDRDCMHLLSPYDKSDYLIFLAGAPLKKGDEICYSYGALRDDYAVAHYGFLPRLEHPPRLSLVDHPDQDPAAYSHDVPPSEEPFSGTPEEMRAEMDRLTAIYRGVKSAPDPLPPQPKGSDYVYDLMKELEGRRLAALEWHIRDLASKLGTKAEL
ncbi:hypothetical protein HXX76_000420 [Chlamydomonas incerta]|uniref:SET domain-containing protein n=1 Tax=Chlamydomonas incerta TaxID=51695 RepID=A0A835WEK8_CHLIN|nr:hypothetical protein HXX76_000420 [Chlamydomonas incerta]|eukprot:KAG2445816.1 hypothetical protein HXX76_000420 [Chlamydomonas incerta]